MKPVRTLARAVIAVLLLAAVCVIGVLIFWQVKERREEDAARKKLNVLVTQESRRIAAGYREDGKLPTTPDNIGTPAVVSQNGRKATVFAHLSVNYENAVFMASTESYDECHLFTLDRIGDQVQAKDKKVSCTMMLRAPVNGAPHLTAGFMSGIRY
ncbi:protein of unknown function [Streptomyces murinus]